MALRLIQINLGKRSSASLELEQVLANDEFDIAIIQEPSTKGKLVTKLSGGQKFYAQNKRQRTCIWLSTELTRQSSCILRNDLSNRDITTVALKIKIDKTSEKNIIISSFYLPHKDEEGKAINDPINNLLEKIVCTSKQENTELILAGDSNSHNTLWGSADNNTRGDKLLEFIMENELTILNTGNLPTWSEDWTNKNSRRSTIDVTLCTKGITEKLSQWENSEIILQSDHKALTFKIDSNKVEPTKFRNPKKTNWENFLNDIKNKVEDINDINDTKELDKQAENLNKTLVDAFYKNCKEKKYKVRFLKVWMKPEIIDSRRALRKMWNKVKRKNLENDKEKFKEARKKHQKLIIEAKKTSWEEKASSIESTRESARLQKLFENGPSIKLGSIRKNDGNFTSTLEESLETLISKHFAGSSLLIENENDEVDHEEQQIREHTDEMLKEIEELINPATVEDIIDSFGPFKSPGGDQIFPALLQKSKKVIMQNIIKIFKGSLKLGYIPKCWRETNIIFIPKPGKEDYGDPKAHRPISLMSFMLKTLEKIIDKHIKSKYLTNFPIHGAQHAYQEGKGTETALHELFTIIGKTFEEKEICLAAFIDIEGAFDNTATDTIIKAARKYEFKPWIINWMESLLKNRVIKAGKGEKSKRFKPKKGCPQGGCLSPLFWCLVLDSLIRELKNAGFEVIAYADDLAIAQRGKFIHGLCNRINEAMKIIEKWCAENGLSVNPHKTFCMKFTRMTDGEKTKISPEIKLFQTNLKFVDTIKYLGVNLDPKISMKSHVEQTYNKSMKALWAAKALINRNWGLRPKMAHWLFNQIIIPRITYASIIWWNTSDFNFQKLEKINRTAMLMITGAVRTTPTMAMNVALNIPPIKIRVQTRAIETFFRLKINNMWQKSPYQSGHRAIEKAALEIHDGREIDVIPKTATVKQYKVTINDRINWKAGSDNFDAVVWYSDGSKRNNKTASGIYRTQDEFSANSRVSDDSTIMQAEVHGIKMCASQSLRDQLKNRNIIIYSDSQAALLALKKGTKVSSTVLECHDELNQLARENNVQLFWVPGHSDIKGNDKADAEANLGIDKPEVEQLIKTPVSKLKELIKNKEQTIFKNLWVKTNKQKYAKNFLEKPTPKRAMELLELSRKKLRLAIGIITGHCLFNKFLFRINKSTTDSCRFCLSEEETMLHFLCDCERIFISRKEILHSEFISHKDLSRFEIEELIKFLQKKEMDKTFFRHTHDN